MGIELTQTAESFEALVLFVIEKTQWNISDDSIMNHLLKHFVFADLNA